MASQKLNLTVDQGTDFSETLIAKNADGTVQDVTGFSASGQIRKSYTSDTATNFTVSFGDVAKGEVIISLARAQTSSLPASRYVYDVELTSAANKRSRLAEGQVTVTQEVTRDGAIDFVTEVKITDPQDGAFLIYESANTNWVDSTQIRATSNTVIDVTGTLEADGFSGTGSVTITDFIDDDSFGTANNTNIATSESVKAYVDATSAGKDALAELDDTNITSASSGQFLIHDGTDSFDNKTISGDIAITNQGVASITAGSIVNADVNASAGIEISKTALAVGTGITLSGNTLSLTANSALTNLGGDSANTTHILRKDGTFIRNFTASTGLELNSDNQFSLSSDAAIVNLGYDATDQATFLRHDGIWSATEQYYGATGITITPNSNTEFQSGKDAIALTSGAALTDLGGSTSSGSTSTFLNERGQFIATPDTDTLYYAGDGITIDDSIGYNVVGLQPNAALSNLGGQFGNNALSFLFLSANGAFIRPTPTVDAGSGLTLTANTSLATNSVFSVNTNLSHVVGTGALNSGSITSGFTSIDIGSGALTAGATTVNGALTVNNNFAEIVSTDAGATDMPVMSLYRNSASPAAGDDAGAIRFFGQNASDEKSFYAGIHTNIDDVTNGDNAGSLSFTVAKSFGAGYSPTITDVTVGAINGTQTVLTLKPDEVSIDVEKLTIGSIDAGSGTTENPVIELYRNPGTGLHTPSDNDELGAIRFFGSNDNVNAPSQPAEKIQYGSIYSEIADASDGTEDGRVRFDAITAGTNQEVLSLQGAGSTFYSDLTINSFLSDGTATNTIKTPTLTLHQEDYPSGDDGDILGQIKFTGKNDNGINSTTENFAGMYAKIVDETDGTEDGELTFTAITNGAANTSVLTLNGSGTTVHSNLTVSGDLTVNGTETVVNSTTLSVDDKNIVLGSVDTPTDTTADGGGITLKGATDKTINWVNSTDSWTASENFELASGKQFRINGNNLLSQTALGSTVLGSSLTSVGTIGTGTWQGTAIANTYVGSLDASKIATGTIADARIAAASVTQHQGSITGTGALNAGSITSGFGNIDIGANTVTAGATTINGELTVNADTLKLTSTIASSTVEHPSLELYRNGGTGSADLGAIKFFGNNNADPLEKFQYAGIYASVQTATDGAEQGSLAFSLGHNGAQEDPAMTLFSYGLQMGYGNPILMSYSNGYQQFFSPNAAQKSFKLNATPNATVANGSYDIYLPDVTGGTLVAANSAVAFTAGATTVNGALAVNNTAQSITDTTTNSYSVYGPTIELYRDGGEGDASSTVNMAQSDKLGTIDFYGNNDAGTPEKIKYAKIFSTIYEETDGAESGRLSFSVINAGTLTEGINPTTILDLEPDVAQFNSTVRLKAAASGGVQATSTPILELYQEDGPQADDGDHLGEIQFTALNNNNYSPIKHKYAGIHAEIIDESNATEDGSLHFTAVTAGTEDTTVLTLNGNGSTLFSDLIAPLTIKSNTTDADLIITNSLDSADASPIIKLHREAGPDGHADGDDVGKLEFHGTNDRGLSSGGPEDVLFGSMFTEVVDSSDGTEDGQIKFTAIKAGSATDVLTLNGTESTFSSPVKVSVGPLTINSGNTNADLVIMNNEQSSADASPIIELYRSQYNGADGEDLGKLEFYGSNDRSISSGGPLKTLYGSIFVEIADASNGSEDGQIKFTAVKAGSATDVLTLNGSGSTLTGSLEVTGGITASQTIANAVTDTDISVSEFATYNGKKIIYTGGAGSVHLADAVAADIGKAWTIINAGTGAITVNRATSTQTIKLLNGSAVSAGSANLTLATGGIIEIICTAADNYIAFGSGIS